MSAYVVGIGGGSGAGKSALAEQLRERLAPHKVAVIMQDHFFHPGERLPKHKNSRGSVWPDHNHPDSFDFARLREEVRMAREGEAEVVLFEGILALYDAELRQSLDLKVFVDTEADERIVRRIRRNVSWGMKLDEICTFYLDSVRYRHDEFCEPTRVYADLIVPGGGDEEAARERVLEVILRHIIQALKVKDGCLERADR